VRIFSLGWELGNDPLRLNWTELPELVSRPSDVGSAMNQKITKASVRIALTCAIAMASSGAAQAHAALHHASPGAGSTVSESPHEVTLTFTDTLEAAFSSADVTDSSGVRVDEVTAGGDRTSCGLGR